MKKPVLIGLVSTVLIGGAGLFYWKTWQADPYRPIKQLAHAMAETESPEKRYEVAVDIAYRVMLAQALSVQPSPFSKTERGALEDAQRIYAEVLARVGELESKLTLEDIRHITASRPDSLYPRIGRFRSSPGLDERCSEDDYRELRRQMPLGELYRRGIPAIGLVASHDSASDPVYLAELIELVKSDARFEMFRPAALAYYPAAIRAGELMKRPPGEEHEMRESGIKELVEAGVPHEEALDYVAKLARLSPRCLGRINIDFVNWVKRDATKERGQYFYGQLADYVRARRSLPAEIDELIVKAGDPLFDGHKDTWHEDFALTMEGEKMRLLSKGPDGMLKTEDDLDFGTVSVLETR